MFPSWSSFQFSKVKASHLINNSVFHAKTLQQKKFICLVHKSYNKY